MLGIGAKVSFFCVLRQARSNSARMRVEVIMEEKKTVWQSRPEELFRELDCTAGGLTTAEAKGRLEKNGYNELVAGTQKSVLRIFLEQFMRQNGPMREDVRF